MDKAKVCFKSIGLKFNFLTRVENYFLKNNNHVGKSTVIRWPSDLSTKVRTHFVKYGRERRIS